MAAGEAIALIFEVGSLEKFAGETKVSSDQSSDEGKDRKLMYLHGLRTKVLGQVQGLSAEAGGKGSAKKDLNSQRNTFRDILDFLEVCFCQFYPLPFACWTAITLLMSNNRMVILRRPR